MRLPDTVDPGALATSGYAEVVDSAKRHACETYAGVLAAQAAQAEAKGDNEVAAVLVLFQAACSLRIVVTPGERALQPAVLRGAYPPTALEDFTDNHLTFFDEALDDIEDAELRARVADLLWHRRFGEKYYRYGLKALEAYRDSCRTLVDQEALRPAVARAERALHLSGQLGRGNNALKDTLSLIENLLHRDAISPFLQTRLLELLVEHGEQESDALTAYAERAAEGAEEREHWHLARRLWEIAAAWRGRSNDDAGCVAAFERGAETHVRHAALLVETTGGRLSVPYHLDASIKAYRRIGGHADRIDELHQELLTAQREAADLIAQFGSSGPVSATSIVRGLEQTEKASVVLVRGHALFDALILFGGAFEPRSVSELRTRVEEQGEQYLLQALFPMKMLSPEGKTLAIQPPPLSTTESERQAAVRAEMFRQHAVYQGVVAVNCIDPARRQILGEQTPTLRELHDVLAPSGWIPPHREATYVRGLHAGLYGDFMASTHLLIPQLEHAIRHVLYLNGHIASGLDDQGIQDEHNLNNLLYRPELVALLGENLVFDLQAVLVNRFAHNLRNRMAHGLLSDSEYITPEAQYLWWLALRLVVLPWLSAYREVKE